MGSGASGSGCSTLCNFSTGTYFNDSGDKTADDITREIIASVRNQSKSKILFSFEGWNLDNLECNYECSSPTLDPLEYLYTDYQGNPVDPKTHGNCSISNGEKKSPS